MSTFNDFFYINTIHIFKVLKIWSTVAFEDYYRRPEPIKSVDSFLEILKLMDSEAAEPYKTALDNPTIKDLIYVKNFSGVDKIIYNFIGDTTKLLPGVKDNIEEGDYIIFIEHRGNKYFKSFKSEEDLSNYIKKIKDLICQL